MTLEIRLRGDAAARLAGPAAALLRAVAGAEPDQRTEKKDGEATRDLGTAVALASLVLSVPGTIVATLDLMERRKQGKLVRELLEKVRATPGLATLRKGSGPPLDLSSATEDQVMDLLAGPPDVK
ncbi:MAG: hypothetical protein AB1921_10210 [Thermodesulfobacteriota bacterium]